MRETHAITEPVRAPTRNELDPDQAALYDLIVAGPRGRDSGTIPLVDDDGRLLGPFGLMTIVPAIGHAVQDLGAAIRFRGRLTPRQRELAILTVAAHHRSEFEWFAHERAARDAGLGPTQLTALKAGGEPAGLDAEEILLTRAVRTLLRCPPPGDPEWRRVRSSLSRETLAELTWLCGYYSMLAVSMAALDPELPPAARGAFEDAEVGPDGE